MHTIYEHGGTHLHVDYELQDVLVINSIRVCGEHYRPVGPDIKAMLDALVVMESPESGVGFLSLVTEYIYAERSVGSGQSPSTHRH